MSKPKQNRAVPSALWLASVCAALAMGVGAGYWLAPGQSGPPSDPGEAEVAAFIDGYFESWSRGDMAAYRAHFHPQATVYYADRESGSVRGHGLSDFVGAQDLLRVRDPRMVERATRKDIRVHAGVATADVGWELKRGDGDVALGMDYFVIARDSGGWKIVALLFREDG